MKRKISLLLVALFVCNMMLFGFGTVSNAVQIQNGGLLKSVAYNGDSENPVYIAVGDGGVMYRCEGSDPSANTWVKIEASSILNASGSPLSTFTANLNGVVYDPDDGIFVAGGQNSTILVSEDNGVSWKDKSATLSAASGARAVYGLSYKNLSNDTKVFISVHPLKAGTRDQAYVGQWDGVNFTWTPLSLSENNSHSIAWNGDKLLIGSVSSVGARGIIHYFDFEGYTGGTPPTSPTGTSATNFSVYAGDTATGNYKPINALTWFNTKWIAVSGNGGSGSGGIYFSTTENGMPSGTGGKWTVNDFNVRQPSGAPANFYGVACSSTAVVAVGSAGAIFYSTDGINYTKKTSGVTADLRSVIYDGSRFVVVGANGQVLCSADGEDWSNPPTEVQPVNYVSTGKMDGNQMLLDETFESLDFSTLTETYRNVPPKDPNDPNSTMPIAISPSAITLYDQGAEGNLQATTVKLALNNDVYIQPAARHSRNTFVTQIETVTKYGITSKALRIKSPSGYGNTVLGFGFNAPQKGTIVLEAEVFYPNLQTNDTRLPRFYAESDVPIDTHDNLATLITSTSMPYFQINNDGTGTMTGGQTTGKSLTDGKWRRVRFIVDTETGKVRTVIYNLDGRYAQDFKTYELNKPGNISYNLENGLIHLGFADDQFGNDGILIDNLKIYREVYYKDPVKPGSISVTKLDGKYYMYTIDAANKVIKPKSSEDMIEWKNEPDIQLNGTWATWNNSWHDFWAAEMYKFNEKYYLAYCAKKDTTLLNESFENINFTSLPEIYRNHDSWSTIEKYPQKLVLTDTGASGNLNATTVELELNSSVRLKPSLRTTDTKLNVEVVTAPKGSDTTNKALKIYNDSDVEVRNALSFVFNTNYRRGETVFEADVKYSGGVDRRMYAESSVPLVTGDNLTTITDDINRPYLEFGITGTAVMSGGINLNNFDLSDTWYHLVLRANCETGKVTAIISDETKSNVLATGQYTFNPKDCMKEGVFHVGFADKQLGTQGILIDNVKIWNTGTESFHRLGIAESDSISGPFTDLGRPLFDSYAAIDPHIFQDTDGKYYLYFSKDVSGNYVMYDGVEERQSHIYGVEMNSDLKSIKGTPVLLSVPTEPYERKSASQGMYWNEAPWVHKYNNTYYLFYSTNCFDSMYYNLCYSTSDSPLGPYTKYSDNPIAQTDGLYPATVLRGLGHNSIVSSPDGSELFMQYCPNQGTGSSGSTSVPEESKGSYFDRMGFRTDGTVYVNGPTRNPQPLPSGINGYTNIARTATLTASSTKSGYSLGCLNDGEIGIYTKFKDLYEWMSDNEKVGAWAQFSWSQPKTITSVAVYDSADPARKLSSGKLTFSNGTTINVTFLNEHGAAAIATFPPMNASWVKFEVTGMQDTGYAGLSEIMVLGKAVTENPGPITGDSTISPTSATFDKYTSSADYKNIDVTVTANGNTLTGIKNGTAALTTNDYTVTGSVYSIKKEYLSTLAVGSTQLMFDFDAGTDPVLTVNVSDSTPAAQPVKSTIATLSNLTVDHGGLTPAFASNTYNYTMSVPYSVSEIGITPTVTSAVYKSMTVNGSALASGTTYSGSLTAGSTMTFTIVVTAEDNSTTRTYTVGVYRAAGLSESSDDSADDSTGGSSGSSSDGPTAAVDGTLTTTEPALDSKTGEVKVSFDSKFITDALDQAKADATGTKTVVVEIPKIEGAASYTPLLPAFIFTANDATQKVTLKTEIASVTAPSNMLANAGVAGAKEVALTIAKADTSKLPADVKTQIGSRPVIDLSVTADGKMVSYNNPDAPVSVSVPYTPTAEELMKHENIVVWYIDESGKASPVPNCKYDPATGMVTFTTTHFSQYAVAFITRSFADMADYAWAKDQVEVMAAKGIINGTSETTFTPAANIKRADLTVILVKALGLSAAVDSNFSDVGKDAYYYEAVGIAKKLGIAKGSGDNKFNPDEEVSRQDMMVLTARAMRMAKKLNAAGASADLGAFTDKAAVADYAAVDVAAMVKEGLVKGDANTINPLGTTTRAEAAVLMYRVFNK